MCGIAVIEQLCSAIRDLPNNTIKKHHRKKIALNYVFRWKSYKPTAPYAVEQMRYLIRHVWSAKNQADRAYLVIQALHPLRLEEVLGLKWAAVDRENMLLHI